MAAIENPPESGASSLTLEGTNDYLLAALVPFTAKI